MSTQTDPVEISKYLIAIDGSEHAKAAVSMVSDMIACQIDKTLAHVYLLAVFPHQQVGEVPKLQQIVDITGQFFINQGITTRKELAMGYPSEKILEFGEEIKPTLVAMGAKGLRSAISILLGGVAQQVVEYGKWPVLVVRAPYKGLHRILIATDGSKCSQRAMEFIRNLPICSKVVIELLHVLPPAPIKVSPEFYASLWPIDTEYLGTITVESEDEQAGWMKEEEAMGANLLEREANLFRQDGMEVITSLKRGDAAEEIINHAQINQVDLIITGTRGLNPIRGWLLGSVSRKLVHYSTCSVMLVRDIAC